MIESKTETMEEYLNRELYGKSSKGKKPAKIRNKKVKEPKQKNKKKGLVVKIVALALIATTAASALGVGIANLFGRNKNKNKVPTTSKDSIVSTVDLDEMGLELKFPEETTMDTPVYGETTGNIKKEQLVVSKDEKTGKTTIWKDPQAKENSKDVGKVETDTKGGTLTVTKSGKVKEKEPGYQVKDEKTGSVISSGNGNTPAGKVWDSEVNAYVDPSEAGKYVICSKDYKDPETGNVIFAKGDQVEKTTLARFEEYVRLYNSKKSSTSSAQSTTSKSSTSSTQSTSSKSSTSSTQSTTTQTASSSTSSKSTSSETTTSTKENASSGTYTVNGLTFKSKADYDQWIIQGYEGYDLVDGIMMSEQERLEYQKTLNR